MINETNKTQMNFYGSVSSVANNVEGNQEHRI